LPGVHDLIGSRIIPDFKKNPFLGVNMSKEQMTFAVVDGGSRNNPGESGCGWHIRDYPNGKV
jgi:hypothetical protein